MPDPAPAMDKGHTTASWYRRMSSLNLSSILNVQYTDTTRVVGKPWKKTLSAGLSGGMPAKATCREIFTAFFTLFLPYFCDRRTRCRSCILLIICMVFMYLEVQTGVEIADKMGELQNTMVGKNVDKFWKTLLEGVLVIARLLPVLVMHLGAATILVLDWRKYLTRRVLDMYISDSSCFYRLKLQYGNLDNPDQRIAQDIGNFCRTSLRLVSSLVQDVMKITVNSAALIKISPRLFYTLVGFSTLYTVISLVFFAAPLMRIQRRVLAVEGDLRYVLVRLREHAESIAFFRGYVYERECSEKVLDHVIWANYKRAAIEVVYRMMTGVVQVGFGLLPMIIVAPMYFRGAVTFGAIQQTQILFQNLMSGMMDLGKELNDIAKLGAESVRVEELWHALKTIEKDEVKPHSDDTGSDEASTAAASSERSSDESVAVDRDVEKAVELEEVLEDLELHEHDPEATNIRLQLACVTLFPPLSASPLVTNLSLTIRSGESLLIEGPSGTGKSSLLRAIAGLWLRGHGSIHRTNLDGCFFLPQTPYLCIGSLRDNVLYPACRKDHEVSNEEIRSSLRALGIEHLVDRHGLDEELDFNNILSGGEKQRLSFARLLLRRGVHLALLDEATSALDEENESSAYGLLRAHVTSYVSVGHRPALARSHSHRLKLQRRENGEGCEGIVSAITEPAVIQPSRSGSQHQL